MLLKKTIPCLILISGAVMSNHHKDIKPRNLESLAARKAVVTEPVAFKNKVTKADVTAIQAEADKIEAAWQQASQIRFKDPEKQDHYQGILAFIKDSKEHVQQYASSLKKQKDQSSFEVYRNFMENESKDLASDGSLLAEFRDLETTRGDSQALAALSEAIAEASHTLETKFQAMDSMQQTLAGQY